MNFESPQLVTPAQRPQDPAPAEPTMPHQQATVEEFPADPNGPGPQDKRDFSLSGITDVLTEVKAPAVAPIESFNTQTNHLLSNVAHLPVGVMILAAISSTFGVYDAFRLLNPSMFAGPGFLTVVFMLLAFSLAVSLLTRREIFRKLSVYVALATVVIAAACLALAVLSQADRHKTESSVRSVTAQLQQQGLSQKSRDELNGKLKVYSDALNTVPRNYTLIYVSLFLQTGSTAAAIYLLTRPQTKTAYQA